MDFHQSKQNLFVLYFSVEEIYRKCLQIVGSPCPNTVTCQTLGEGSICMQASLCSHQGALPNWLIDDVYGSFRAFNCFSLPASMHHDRPILALS